MSRRVGVIGKLLNNLRNSLGAPRQTVHFVGQDHLGNKYYEKEADPKRNLRGGRWTETRDGDEFQPPDVPVEWEAWLRGRRDDPPTQEELDRNYVTMMKTIARAKERNDQIGNTEISSDSTPGPGINIGRSTTTEDRNKAKFPVYEGMESSPGDSWQRR